jgi:SAM-dependent methyltransferase
MPGSKSSPNLESDYDLFGADYFKQRRGNDHLRQVSFAQERSYLALHLGPDIFLHGVLLDVGCSTGEFIKAMGWNMDLAFGMEISDYARQLAAGKGVRFDRDLFTAEAFFDVVVFRGTIQYIPEPFQYIKRAFLALKSGGCVVFLATPNTNSPYYRHFGTLPFLEERLNYLIPCDNSLAMNLRNAGFDVLTIDYPYLSTPYARPFSDHLKFLKKLLFRTDDRFAFWRSSMWMIGRRPVGTK